MLLKMLITCFPSIMPYFNCSLISYMNFICLVSGCFSFCFIQYSYEIFSRTEQILIRRQAFASFKHGLLRSKENVNINDFQHLVVYECWCVLQFYGPYHQITIGNFSIVEREDQNLIRDIKEAIYIRVKIHP